MSTKYPKAELAGAAALVNIDGKTPADPATVTAVDAVAQAIVDLGDGSTIDQVVTAVNAVNTTLGSPLPLPTGAATETTVAAIETAVESLNTKQPDAIDIGAGQLVVPVAVLAGEIDAKQSGTWNVGVNNFPADPANATNQLALGSKLDDVIELLNGGLPTALIDGLLGVKEANSTLIFTEASQINAKLPDLSTVSVVDSQLAVVEQNSSVIYNRVDAINTKLGSALPLPTGASTEVTLASLLALTGTALGPWVDHAPITVAAEPSGATQLPSYACSEMKIIADVGNTHPIYFGGSGVDSTKSQDLNARELEIVTRITNTNQFYVVAATGHSGQKVRVQTR